MSRHDQNIKKKSKLKKEFVVKTRPTDSAYSLPILVKVIEFMERHGLFRFTIKIPSIVGRFLTYFAASFLIKFGPWKRKIGKNLDIIFRNKLDQKYGKELARKIKYSIAFINARNSIQTLVHDFFLYAGFCGYKDLVLQKFNLAIYKEFEKIDKIMEEGKGLIVMSLHSGAFLIMATCLGLFKRVGKFKHDSYLAFEEGSNDAFIKYTKRGIRVVDLKQGDKSDRKSFLYKVAKKNGILLLGVDQGHKNYPKLPLFGKKALTPMGPAIMATRYGTKVMSGLNFVNSKNSTFTVKTWGPLNLKAKEDYPDIPERELITENAIIINKEIEKMILRTYPSWLYLMIIDKLKRIE